ncbi:MAG: hypothetical protein F9K37_08610 [Bacteroidales bacterium]|nr:MAG: hypothetical protein F9K37_08610 [Bacteroidales bacterium]
MTTYNNTYAQQIYSVLSPLVGEFMAKGVLKSQVQRIGKTEEAIVKEDLPHLADGICKGLVVFVGTDVAQKVAAKIKSF